MACGATFHAYCVWSLGRAACSASRTRNNALDMWRSSCREIICKPCFFPQTDLSGSHLSEKQDDPLLTYLGPHVRVRRWTGSYFRSSWSLDILNSWFKCKCWIFWTHELIFCQCGINEILIKDHIHFLECITLEYHFKDHMYIISDKILINHPTHINARVNRKCIVIYILHILECIKWKYNVMWCAL